MNSNRRKAIMEEAGAAPEPVPAGDSLSVPVGATALVSFPGRDHSVLRLNDHPGKPGLDVGAGNSHKHGHSASHPAAMPRARRAVTPPGPAGSGGPKTIEDLARQVCRWFRAKLNDPPRWPQMRSHEPA